MLIAFNKPYGVLSQFTSDDGKATLADFIDVPRVYAAGRLDFDSEGLLLLTDDGRLQRSIADPKQARIKRYWAQVEGIPTTEALGRFRAGLTIGDGAAQFQASPATARLVDASAIPERSPPIRFRANIPATWIEVAISEGKNRQVRRMTAAIGHPTLRLMRVRIGALDLLDLSIAPGVWIAVEADRLGLASVARRAKPGGSAARAPQGAPRPNRLSTGLRSRR
jgi:23S rRNA pseudouridine2457 synthase